MPDPPCEVSRAALSDSEPIVVPDVADRHVRVATDERELFEQRSSPFTHWLPLRRPHDACERL